MATEAQWRDLEAILTAGYASPAYRAWYEAKFHQPMPSGWENFDPIKKGRDITEQIRRSFESGSRYDFMSNNPYSAKIIRAAYGFKTTKEWRDAWMGPRTSTAQVKRDERARKEAEGVARAELDFKRGRFIRGGTKMNDYWRAYLRRIRELHGMSPDPYSEE